MAVRSRRDVWRARLPRMRAPSPTFISCLSALVLAACSGESAAPPGASAADGGAQQSAAVQAGSGRAGTVEPVGGSTATARAGVGAAQGGGGSPSGTGSQPSEGDNASGAGAPAGVAGRTATEPSMDAGVAVGGGGGGKEATPAAMSCERCSAYGAPQKTGSVEPTDLNALSGLAASRAQPGIVFAHNDHDRPVVYALDLQGRMHARIRLQGATATDIEDIAVGPCGADTCVYLADVGDNAAQRGEYGILRFKQPQVPDAPGASEMTASFERFRFTYEDGSHNAESLMVGPDGALYVLTKLAPGSGGSVSATGPSSVYKLDPSKLSTTQVAQATKVASLTIPKSGEAALSAAAAHPCGKGFLVRTYDKVYEFQVPAGSTDFEKAFTATPTVVAMPDEPQSEAIDYQPSGKGFITSGEGGKAPIYSTDCAP